MRTLTELGNAFAERRKRLGLKQGQVARQAGLTQELLSRFERAHVSEFGSRKLLALLAVLGLELDFTQTGSSGSLDELRRERGRA
jgi:HTH-type transcriptional regulator/antitoxin HipB